MCRPAKLLTVFAVVVASTVIAAGGLALARGGDVSVATKSVQVKKQINVLIARCPSGARSLGGGFSAPKGSLISRSTFAAGTGWRVRFATQQPGGSAASSTICDRSDRRLKRVKKLAVIGAGKRRSVVATCPSGWQVLAGGFAVLPPFFITQPVGVVLVDSSMAGSKRSWRVSAINATLPATLAAYAICEPATQPPIRKVVAKSALTATGGAGAEASCGAGGHLLGGGFNITPAQTVANFFAVIDRSSPVGTKRWRSAATTNSSPPPPGSAKLTSIAYCERDR